MTRLFLVLSGSDGHSAKVEEWGVSSRQLPAEKTSSELNLKYPQQVNDTKERVLEHNIRFIRV